MIAAEKIMIADKMTAADRPSSAQPMNRYAKPIFDSKISSITVSHSLISALGFILTYFV